MTEKEKSSKSASSEMDKLLDELETLVNADKTPKPQNKEIERVWNICRKLTGVIE